MNAQEATERQVKALEQAERQVSYGGASANANARTWIKIAAGWDSLIYRLEDAELSAVRMAELRAKVAEMEAKGSAND